MKRCPKCAGIYSDDIKICGDCNIELVDKENFSKASYDLRAKESQKNQQCLQGDTRKNTLKQESQIQCIPKCPICQSTNIHKISATNKVGSALMFGIFAAGHVSKTFKCDNCGAKF